jgi:hypothetical protein
MESVIVKNPKILGGGFDERLDLAASVRRSATNISPEVSSRHSVINWQVELQYSPSLLDRPCTNYNRFQPSG